jgi:hypothetical protein
MGDVLGFVRLDMRDIISMLMLVYELRQLLRVALVTTQLMVWLISSVDM